MSLGTEFEPLLRRSGSVGMKVNIRSIVLDKDETVAAVLSRGSWRGMEYICSLTKQQIKKELKDIAPFLAYQGYVEDEPSSEANCEQYFPESLELWRACSHMIEKHFPAFDYLKGESK